MYEILDRSLFEDDSAPARAEWRQSAVTTHVALIGGFTPRRCGIATFTADIYASLMAASPDLAIDVYAMTAGANLEPSHSAVHATIADHDRESYARAAHMINQSGADVVWLQHEFGLFGGAAGDMVLGLVDRIAAPLIVTLHTVLESPDRSEERRVGKECW